MFLITIMRKSYLLNIINGIGWLLFNTIFKNIYNCICSFKIPFAITIGEIWKFQLLI